MKKIIAFVLILSMLILALVSCGEQTVPSESVATPQIAAPTGEPITSVEPATSVEPSATGSTPSQSATEPIGTPEESTTGNGTAGPHIITSSGYSLTKNDRNSINFVETPSKIIFLQTISGSGAKSLVYYYSKADGEFYPFCFDPLCQHQDIWDGEEYVGTTCIARMLYPHTNSRSDALTPPLYCNGRIYFAYFDEIWSCNEYATDIRIEASFSKMTDNITRTEAMKRFGNSNGSGFETLICGGTSVYFNHIDADGEVRYYRIDTETGKLHNISKETNDLAKELGAEKMYFRYAFGKYIVFHASYPDTGKGQKITTDKDLKITDVPFLGENDVISIWRNTANGQLCMIRRFDENNNLLFSEYVEVMPDGECKSLDTGDIGIYVTDNYTYSYGGESITLGPSKTIQGKEEVVVNQSPEIVRYNKATGEKEVLFHDDWLKMDTIYYVNEETGEFLARVKKFAKDGEGYVSSRSNLIYKGRIVDGKLIDFQKAQVDDEESVEPPFVIPGWPTY